MSGWAKKQEWWLRGKDYLVTVYHSKGDANENLWRVYCYIYPKHSRYESLKDLDKLFDDRLHSFPLHSGCSFIRKHFDNDGKQTSIQIGCDYNHLYDSYYLTMETEHEASIIFNDAEQLFEFLKEE